MKKLLSLALAAAMVFTLASCGKKEPTPSGSSSTPTIVTPSTPEEKEAARAEIRNAISLGGDSDTLAAITGSIAEAAYGIPDWIEEKALSYLDTPLLDVVVRWKQYLGSTK